ncbi:MAG: hypothetical protein WD971_02175 [Pirellulales bacterium]
MKQQSQILFWLLLAATAAVDIVAITWLLEAGPESRAAFLYDALVTGQLAVVALWGVFGARRSWAAWCAALAAVGVAGALTARLAQLSLAESCGIHGSSVALLAATLWVLKRTPIWQRLAGKASAAGWQYSMGHLLAAMTIIALLIAALRGSVLLLNSGESWKFFVTLTLGDVVLATSIAFIWLWTSWFPRWWPRLAAVLLPALAVGALEAGLAMSGLLGPDVAQLQEYSPFDLVAYTLMASIVIFAYLELAPIIRRDQRAVATPLAGTDSH